MKKITEAHWLSNDCFNVESNGGEERFIYFLAGLAGSFLWSIVACAFTIGPMWYSPVIVIPIMVAMWLITTFGIWNIGGISVLSGIPDSYYSGESLLYQAKKYLDLSPQDKSYFPDNILDVMKDGDLTKVQKEELLVSMKNIHGEIERRNRVKANVERELSRKHVDAESVIDRLNDSVASIREEASVYQEEAQRLKQDNILG